MSCFRAAPLLLAIFAGVFASLPARSADDASGVIVRKGWSFDRSDLQWYDRVDPAAEKAKGELQKVAGWTEYDVIIPATGWYELWLGGDVSGWARDIYVDGVVIDRRSVAMGSDILPKPTADGIDYKEINFFVTQGKHSVRIRRMSFPALLPNIIEIRPSNGNPAGSIRASVAGTRIVAPGGKITVSFLGGTSAPTDYSLFLQNETTLELTPVGEVQFSVLRKPVTKDVVIPFEKEGLYTLLAKVDGQMLRPGDIKAGLFLAALPQQTHVGPVAPPPGDLQFAGLFQDSGVLQRDKPLPVWGWAPAGETITVTLADQTARATADADGSWQVIFKPLALGGGPYDMKAVSSSGKEITCHDLVVGDVWLLSGQSNMQIGLLGSIGGEDAAKAANLPDVRRGYADDPLLTGRLLPFEWKKAVSGGDPKAMSAWTGIEFSFGSDLNQELKVPIGMIEAARGGTYVSTWTSHEAMESSPAFRKVIEGYARDHRDRVAELVYLEKTREQIGHWKTAVEKATKAGTPAPALDPIYSTFRQINDASLDYDVLIKHIAPYAIRGVVWYQGENDIMMGVIYRKRFEIMVQDWRHLWQDPALPFVYAQICYGTGTPYLGDPRDDWNAELRDAQSHEQIPHSAMIVTYDLMRPQDNVHYPDKLPVGHRMALAALATVYGKDVPYTGPIYQGFKIENGKIRISFDHVVKGLQSKDGAPLGGFAIAGADHKWVWADAAIDGNTVVVQSAQVPQPVAVRYAWTGTPHGANLFDQSGLPASGFRTDDWPLITQGVEWKQEN